MAVLSSLNALPLRKRQSQRHSWCTPFTATFSSLALPRPPFSTTLSGYAMAAHMRHARSRHDRRGQPSSPPLSALSARLVQTRSRGRSAMQRPFPRMLPHPRMTGMVSQSGQGPDPFRVTELRCWAPVTLRSSHRTARAGNGCDRDKRSQLQAATKHI